MYAQQAENITFARTMREAKASRNRNPIAPTMCQSIPHFEDIYASNVTKTHFRYDMKIARNAL